MKPFSLVLFLAVSLGLAFNLHAAITVINDWHMGESDPGASGGEGSFSTLDSVGGNTLFNQPANDLYPPYTNNVSSTAAFLANSDLSIFYSAGQYGVANVLPNLTANFGMELWVYPTAGSGGQVIAYDGETATNGWGIYLSGGTNCAILFADVHESANPVPLATNTWTEVALVDTGNTATLYTNGVPALSIRDTPKSPTGNFLIAGDNSGLETFSGAVDEVRVFTFGSGQFSPTNLLVNGPLVVTNAADSGRDTLRAALSAAVGGSTITFAPSLSGQTILLASGALPVNYGITIDASALPGGIQINGNRKYQVFNVYASGTNVFNSLTITNGIFGNNGAGISNGIGTLILNQCILAGNLATNGGLGGLGNLGGGGLYNDLGTVTLNQCTLSGNSARGAQNEGGGIYNFGTMTLNQCILSGNSATNGGFGGGIGNEFTITLNECTLSGNRISGLESEGGGLYNDGTAILNNCTLSGNSATNSGFGGGLGNEDTVTLNECTFSGNKVGGSSAPGGGLYNDGPMTANECTLSGNRADNGGAIYNLSTVSLNECTLSGNSCVNNGGGFYNDAGTFTLNQCTLSGNNVTNYGGGIYCFTGTLTLNDCTLSGNSANGSGTYGGGILEYDSALVMTNTIVAGNSAASDQDMFLQGGTITYGGANLVQYVYYDGATVYGPTPLNAAPGLAPLGYYGGSTPTMPPLPGSPAVDAGDDSVTNLFTTDQRGFPRLAGLHVDLGAVEGVYSANAIILTGAASLPNGSFQFGFTGDEDMTFNVYATTNLALPFDLWQNLGYAAGAPAGSGQFQFTDTGATSSPQRFYQVVSP